MATAVLNLVIVVGYLALLRSGDNEINDDVTIFLVFLLTLVVVLSDRVHLVRSARAITEHRAAVAV